VSGLDPVQFDRLQERVTSIVGDWLESGRGMPGIPADVPRSAVRLTPDRSMLVPAGHVARTAYVPVFSVELACRDRMAVGDVEAAYRRLLQLGDASGWPPPVGHWTEDRQRFVIVDGRHEYVAALMLGREHVLVAWVEAGEVSGADPATPRAIPRDALAFLAKARPLVLGDYLYDQLLALVRGEHPEMDATDERIIWPAGLVTWRSVTIPPPPPAPRSSGTPSSSRRAGPRGSCRTTRGRPRS
jgi:hypothetical protein